MSGMFIAPHSGQVIAKLLDEVLELDGLERIEVMKPAVDSPECPDALGRDHQLRGGFGALRLPTLQRQKADDQLKTVDEPMLEFLRQNFLRSQGLILLAQQRRACERVLRLGGACGSPLLARSGRSACAPCNPLKISLAGNFVPVGPVILLSAHDICPPPPVSARASRGPGKVRTPGLPARS